MLARDTAGWRVFSESKNSMNPETEVKSPIGEIIRPALVTLAPKRRCKFVSATVATAAPPVSIVPQFPRRARMRRSGQLSFHWRNVSNEERSNTIRISPEILSAFNGAFGALGKSSAKQEAHAAA
jgi:hypothetical protein